MIEAFTPGTHVIAAKNKNHNNAPLARIVRYDQEGFYVVSVAVNDDEGVRKELICHEDDLQLWQPVSQASG